MKVWFDRLASLGIECMKRIPRCGAAVKAYDRFACYFDVHHFFAQTFVSLPAPSSPRRDELREPYRLSSVFRPIRRLRVQALAAARAYFPNRLFLEQV